MNELESKKPLPFTQKKIHNAQQDGASPEFLCL
jgi:hypothetical protein